MFLRKRAHDAETRRITRGQWDSLFYKLSSNAHVLQRWWDLGVPDRHVVFVVDGVAKKGDGVSHAFLEKVNSRLIPSFGFDKGFHFVDRHHIVLLSSNVGTSLARNVED